ncbi:formylglycine-generating enzyme family protein [Thermodesulfobacteriota bacterium]
MINDPSQKHLLTGEKNARRCFSRMAAFMLLSCLINVFQTAASEKAEVFTNSVGMQFVLIPAGNFLMGSPRKKYGDVVPNWRKLPRQYNVTITKAFLMQTTEVTQAQWYAVMEENPAKFSNCGDDCAVESVSWLDVQEFILRLNLKEGQATYRLPTEAEWEYACRAGTETHFSWGDEADCLRANFGNGRFVYDYNEDRRLKAAPSDSARGGSYKCEDNPGGPTIVGSYPPNPWGLFDMHGNVWEWVQDRYGQYPRKKSVINPKGPAKGYVRVFRGGSWYNDPFPYCFSAFRNKVSPKVRKANLGFRLVKQP